MQYTIEARELTNEYTHRPATDGRSRSMVVEALSPEEALSKFLLQNRSELVSVTRPARGRESIATVRKDDSVYLLRVYAA